ncbi:protein FAR1-RELATED SEQUENCE 5-like [Brachypodium distachyon]|uniref:protein FAR1-RELATED SEQUENCE 5-like n=1 Tax=Brachypodium distachyon TaxID=15368 RepID=UPI00052FFA5A|nr:protein FAR1-RELATED SEQUENCE 5-like [Brachypodium distachyon]|eukprot:XP_024310280.1 protein FAR1-RELATED SEQUENCE 5-like [Brachypodium distachyon]
MAFDNMEEVEEFYKAYAHNVGFSVRIGQKRTVDNVVVWRRFLCGKSGFRRNNEEEPKKELNGEKKGDEKKRTHARKITRCGCEAMITVKRMKDGKYAVSYFHEEHTHEFVTPRKQHLIKSNRQVSDKAKDTLFTCHAASIGTAGAFRLLRVGEGGFEFVGCTKRDLQNYHRDMRSTFKDSDAQMFIDNLRKRQEINPGFFFEYVLDDKNWLTHVFWADACCRKNYALFGEMVSFDSTYSTNQYSMIFCPFTGINHHMASVFYGAALIVNETIESYKWVFQTFLKAMDGAAPRLIVTDEDQSMKIAIEDVMHNTVHRLCMWHIMRKLPEKVGPPLREDEHFYSTINSCVWGSENPTEFEAKWSSMISEFGLEDNTWFSRRYELHESWIPAYFRGVFLGEILRTTSRSESANSFFNHFIGYKHALVEFWIRIGTALEEQRQNELKAGHECLNSMPPLITSWEIEKHASLFFTHAFFSSFQKETYMKLKQVPGTGKQLGIRRIKATLRPPGLSRGGSASREVAVEEFLVAEVAVEEVVAAEVAVEEVAVARAISFVEVAVARLETREHRALPGRGLVEAAGPGRADDAVEDGRPALAIAGDAAQQWGILR